LAGSGGANVAAGSFAYVAWNRQPEVYFRKVTTEVTSLSGGGDGRFLDSEVTHAWPNPFNSLTHFSYSLEKSEQVYVAVYDLLGQKVRTLVDAHQAPGTYRVTWDAINDFQMPVSSGLYQFLFLAGVERRVKSTMLLR
jgi:hypothetical protein